MKQGEKIWSVQLDAAAVPPEGQELDISADPEVREPLAKSLGLLALDRLQLKGRADRAGSERVRIVGTLDATVTQTCVVSLDPVVNEISEAIEVVFAPDQRVVATDDLLDVSVDTPDPPEVLHSGRIDLAALAIEFLQLGLDPYPRRPDAIFEPPPADDAAGGPFAALESLKNRGQSS